MNCNSSCSGFYPVVCSGDKVKDTELLHHVIFNCNLTKFAHEYVKK